MFVWKAATIERRRTRNFLMWEVVFHVPESETQVLLFESRRTKRYMYTLAPDTNLIGNRVVDGNQNQSRHMRFFMFFTWYWYAEYIWELSRILISTWCVSRLWQRENNSKDVAYLGYLTKTFEMLLKLSWITSRFLLVFHSFLAYRQVLTCFLQEKSSEFHKKTNKWQRKTKKNLIQNNKTQTQIERQLVFFASQLSLVASSMDTNRLGYNNLVTHFGLLA